MHRVLALLCFGSFVGCGGLSGLWGSDPLPELTADRPAYSPGDTVAVSLYNGTTSRVEHNLCFGQIERSTADGWRPSRACPRYESVEPDGTCFVQCSAVAYVTAQGGAYRYAFRLPLSFPNGTYRYAAEVEVREGRRDTVRTSPFEVRTTAEVGGAG